MATFDADLERAVAIELKEKMLTLYMAVLPIYRASSQWILNGTDPMLPDPFAVKVQLDAYKALQLELLKLSDWVTELQGAAPDDTLTYPPPPTTYQPSVVYSEQIIFDEQLVF